MPKKQPILIAVQSLGCAKNLVDTEVMCGLLASEGCIITNDLEEAAFFLINTCGFIQHARDEAASVIREAVKWKKAGRRLGLARHIIVAGCLAQRYAAEYAGKFPEVDCFMGLDAVPDVVKIIKKVMAEGAAAPIREVSPTLPQYLYDEKTPRLLCTPESYAYIKIAEGCNHRCAFCAIPGIRGNLRSRSLDSVLTEARQLLERGVRELDLIAQDTTAYGVDQHEPDRIVKLLRALDELEGDFWVRVLYTHPFHLTDEFIDALANSRHGHILPYLDVPLQHIAGHILTSMRRGLNEEKTRSLMASIREKYPELTVRTTFMTGYPGETDEDFENLYAFVRDFGFDRLGAFAFSPEEGTSAAEIKEGLVPKEIAEKRLSRLMKLQKDISRKRNKSLIGRKMKVLVEDFLDDGTYLARSAADAPDVDQAVHIIPPEGSEIPLNEFCEVLVTAASHYDLMAKLA